MRISWYNIVDNYKHTGTFPGLVVLVAMKENMNQKIAVKLPRLIIDPKYEVQTDYLMSWLNSGSYSKNHKTFLVAAKLKNIILLNLPVWILITSISAFNLSLSAQKEIKIEQDLKAHSQPLEVKRRGIKTIGKYQFGSYEILSGKAGWVEYPGSFSLGEQLMEDISGMRLEKSESKSSFILLSDQKDTIDANIYISNQRQIVEGNRRFVIGIDRDDLSRQIFAVRFNSILDHIWNMVIISPLEIETIDYESESITQSTLEPDSRVEFKGTLSNGTLTVHITQVFEREDGKSAVFHKMMNRPRGYEFFLENQSIGAVQVLPVNRQIVWIKDELDEEMKGVVATTAVSILLRDLDLRPDEF